MKTIILEETIDLMLNTGTPQEEVTAIFMVNQVKTTESGINYLLIKENDKAKI